MRHNMNFTQFVVQETPGSMQGNANNTHTNEENQNNVQMVQTNVSQTDQVHADSNTKAADDSPNGHPPGHQVLAVLNSDESSVTFLRPIDANSFGLNLDEQQQNQIITLPITVHGAKAGDPQQTLQIQLINSGPPGSDKVVLSQVFVPSDSYIHNGNGGMDAQLQEGQLMDCNELEMEDNLTRTINRVARNQDLISDKSSEVDLRNNNASPFVVIPDVYLRPPEGDCDQSADSGNKNGESEDKKDWQFGATTATSMAEYLAQFTGESFPSSMQQFLKFTADTIKKENKEEVPAREGNPEVEAEPAKEKKKKRYRKRPPKPKRPRPGQVHIATALDGTMLYCCPECNMAYPEKDMLEQHLVAHKIERRFICGICGAGLKRKEHLERHKLGHNPARPFICEVCNKGFKRKEHLTLHSVIHSGNKTEICGECGKGFYRKDHLRKHMKSHVAKRIREEVQQRTQMLEEQAKQGLFFEGREVSITPALAATPMATQQQYVMPASQFMGRNTSGLQGRYSMAQSQNIPSTASAGTCTTSDAQSKQMMSSMVQQQQQEDENDKQFAEMTHRMVNAEKELVAGKPHSLMGKLQYLLSSPLPVSTDSAKVPHMVFNKEKKCDEGKDASSNEQIRQIIVYSSDQQQQIHQHHQQQRQQHHHHHHHHEQQQHQQQQQQQQQRQQQQQIQQQMLEQHMQQQEEIIEVKPEFQDEGNSDNVISLDSEYEYVPMLPPVIKQEQL